MKFIVGTIIYFPRTIIKITINAVSKNAFLPDDVFCAGFLRLCRFIIVPPRNMLAFNMLNRAAVK